MTQLIFLYVAAFVLGSLPIGFLIGRLKGVDVRTTGSGNTGATNIARSLGKTAGIITLVGDMAKGILAVFLAYFFPVTSNPIETSIMLGLFAILGHCFSPFLKFRGGKGVATSLGVFLILAPVQALLCIMVFIVTLSTGRFVSLASMCGVSAMPVLVFFSDFPESKHAMLFASLLTAVLIVYRHKTNIARLRDGTESRMAFSKQTAKSS